MLIQCPKCNRSGEIPDRFELGRHRVRCRICEMRFWIIPLTAKDKIDRLAEPIEESPTPPGARRGDPLPYRGVSASFDDGDDDSTLDALCPWRFSLQLTVMIGDHDDSQVGEFRDQLR